MTFDIRWPCPVNICAIRSRSIHDDVGCASREAGSWSLLRGPNPFRKLGELRVQMTAPLSPADSWFTPSCVAHSVPLILRIAPAPPARTRTGPGNHQIPDRCRESASSDVPRRSSGWGYGIRRGDPR
jgi:hypothetical protein